MNVSVKKGCINVQVSRAVGLSVFFSAVTVLSTQEAASSEVWDINYHHCSNMCTVFLGDVIVKKWAFFVCDLLYNHSATIQCPEGTTHSRCLSHRTQQAVSEGVCDFKREGTVKALTQRERVEERGDEKVCQEKRGEWDDLSGVEI